SVLPAAGNGKQLAKFYRTSGKAGLGRQGQIAKTGQHFDRKTKSPACYLVQRTKSLSYRM
ncbi:hypothetical protein LJD63_10155, partial [Veillonella nakazawae]